MAFRELFIQHVYRILRPLAKIALRHGITADDLCQVAKKAMVDTCAAEYGIRGRPTSKSRIATMTNLSRADVAKLLEQRWEALEKANHPVLVLVGLWLRDAKWLDGEGQPKALSVSSPDNGFQALARQASSAVPHQTLLREILRLGIAEQQGDSLHLVKHGFIPGDGEDSLMKFLGEDAAALIDTVSYNMHQAAEANDVRRYQRKAAFFNLSDEGMQALQQIAESTGQSFLEDTDKRLSDYRVPDTEQTGRLRGIGIYTFDLELHEENTDEKLN